MHENCRYGHLKILDFLTDFAIFTFPAIFTNVEPYMDRTIHIFRYVELNMDRTVINSGILRYVWTVRSILSGMLTYMDHTVHIMSGIRVIYGPYGLYNIWVIYGPRDPGWEVRGTEPPSEHNKQNMFFCSHSECHQVNSQ